MSWTWTAAEWWQIEVAALQEQSHRSLAAELVDRGRKNTTHYRATRAVADGAALELRQWAHVASSIYSSELINQVRRLNDISKGAGR